MPSDPSVVPVLSRSAQGPSGHDPSVADIRHQLDQDFAPRVERAIARYAPRLSEEVLGDVSCLVVDPKRLQSDGVILYFFGGGYVSGAPEYELPVAAHLAERCGLRVILPRYSLAPEHPYPAALNEAFAVYAALIKRTLGRIVVAGESAGGGLALCLLPVLAEQGIRPPEGLCLFSPWVDLSAAGIDSGASTSDPMTELGFLRTAARAYCRPEDIEAASPALCNRGLKLPKTYLSTGSVDIMRPSLEAFQAQQTRLGAPIDMKIWPGMWHAFELYDEAAEAAHSMQAAADLVKKALGASGVEQV